MGIQVIVPVEQGASIVVKLPPFQTMVQPAVSLMKTERYNGKYSRRHGKVSSMTEAVSSIKQAAEFTGMSEDTIRYYEKIGLLPYAERKASGHKNVQ